MTEPGRQDWLTSQTGARQLGNNEAASAEGHKGTFVPGAWDKGGQAVTWSSGWAWLKC